jgi:hypothetical protein
MAAEKQKCRFHAKASGALRPRQTLSAPHGLAAPPSVGTDANCNATVRWSVAFSAEPLQARQIFATGALGPLQNISTTHGISNQDIAVNPEGDAFAVWTVLDGRKKQKWARARTERASRGLRSGSG